LLLLNNSEVEQVLTMDDCLGLLRRFFEEEGEGQVLTRQRSESWLPHRAANTFYQCKTMEGGVPYIGKYVIRIDSNVTRKKQHGDSSRIEHIPFGSGSWMGMLLVFSTETGELLGWMPDGYLQRTRVGALYALAADYLARPDAEEVGLIGSGWQAGGQILGLLCVRNIKKVRVYSSDAVRRSRFADELQASVGIEVRPVASARDAVSGVDIVVLATNANEKVMESSWLEPGQHLSSVRFLELDPRAYEDCDRVVINRVEPWINNYYLGELCPQDIRDAKVPPAPAGAIESRDFFRQGLKRVRMQQDKTLFPNEASNYQLGGQFAAVAGFVLDRAHEKGLGRELPAEWFAQTLLP
jgi:ornithine cyclodeaminase/alanine dehydrogenase-like protein (mu-crystallin family)